MKKTTSSEKKNETIDYEKEKIKLKDNPHFQNGLYWGTKMVKFIDQSIYENLEHALGAKKVFAEQLKNQLGFKTEHPDLAEQIGTITALQEAISKEEEE